MGFPATRLRRTRRTPLLRRMVRETRLTAANLVLPLFVCPGEGIEQPIPSMPGVARQSVDRIVATAAAAHGESVPAVILFGLPEHKDAVGSAAWSDDGIVQRAVRALAAQVPDLLRIVDVCFCEYTDHGHCGVLRPDGSVDNDATLENLTRQAVSLARAGADVVAPSDMMDGRVGAIRRGLDAAGLADTIILAYAAKFASGFYGPFRDAADSTPSFGDRRGYQMDPANRREALREVALDVEEGADVLMVKPAMAYLDVLAALRQRFDHPLAAYHVSGEYAMLKAAAQNGWLDYDRVLMESLVAMRRAGADWILTYAAREAAALLAKGWEE
ncbi:MAG TPA: porphobilinogen synthase [Thermoanaerobaculia bacterium]|jgi:porphobilinogen synthase|nr:porphobilinogen synthase [Thermoanaerobaculia bacterium]